MTLVSVIVDFVSVAVIMFFQVANVWLAVDGHVQAALHVAVRKIPAQRARADRPCLRMVALNIKIPCLLGVIGESCVMVRGSIIRRLIRRW